MRKYDEVEITVLSVRKYLTSVNHPDESEYVRTTNKDPYPLQFKYPADGTFQCFSDVSDKRKKLRELLYGFRET